MKEPTTPLPRAGTTSGGSTPGGSKAPDLMYNAANDDIHILDRLAVVYRYRRIALTVFVLASAAMMIQGYSNIQVYQAQGRLLIESERSTALPWAFIPMSVRPKVMPNTATAASSSGQFGARPMSSTM